MQNELINKFAALPRLGPAAVATRTCKICGGVSLLFDVVDFYNNYLWNFGLSGITFPYYRCSTCEFIFTDLLDEWKPKEFSRFIYNDDYIKVDPEYTGARPISTAQHMALLLRGCEHLRILDYGSGSGIFSDEMKKHGFLNMENYDPFSAPEKPRGPFDIILLFEVIEHVPRPMETFYSIREYLSDYGAIMIGQTLQPHNIGEIRGNWWYLAPRNGHVSTYSKKTFLKMAELGGFVYYHGTSLYGFARTTVLDPIVSALRKFGTVASLARLLSSNSLMDDKPGWHGLERAGDRFFRWTSSSEIIWSIKTSPHCQTTVDVPFLMEVERDFAARSKIVVDGLVIPTTVKDAYPHGRTITAEIDSNNEATRRVQLLTPPLTSPMSQGRGDDQRLLGLAIESGLRGE
jgi:hypothetical protein